MNTIHDRKQRTEPTPFREDVELSGHLLDSLLLPKVLDVINAAGGSFDLSEMSVGRLPDDPSYIRMRVGARNQETLDSILAEVAEHGARPVNAQDARLVTADIRGAFPDGFYSTTNRATEIRIAGEWVPVEYQEMDCGIAVDLEKKHARCVPMTNVEVGQDFAVGHAGVRLRVDSLDKGNNSFEFMNSEVSSEKPKAAIIRQIAKMLLETKQRGQKSLLVGGPAIIHTGSSEHICRLLRDGLIHRLFAGNALATHDIEQALFGTSLGVQLEHGSLTHGGHEHHLRAINHIRRWGGIRKSVDAGRLTRGIMFECVRNDVDFLLAGSIRDDGPLPEVVTDALEAQRKMREQLSDVGFCLMVATMLHSVAVGNLLPASTPVVCVDINPSAVIKLNDRGSAQTFGVVTDVEPFLRSLLTELEHQSTSSMN